jgi:uncharacterized protein (DUF169 family)
MLSKIAQALKPKYPPVGLYRTPELPAGARMLKERTSLRGGWGCAMFLLAQAFQGHLIAYSGQSCHCPGAAQGLGLQEPPLKFPGGPMGALRLISCGNKHFEDGRQAIEELKAAGASKEVLEEFGDGEGFKKTPELTLQTFMALPKIGVNTGFLVAEPLASMESRPEVVIFLADGLQLAALTVLANFTRPTGDNVIIPFAAGCASIALFPLAELNGNLPRAVVGLLDLSARVTLKKILGRNLVSCAVPYPLFAEMESQTEESFLSKSIWENCLK